LDRGNATIFADDDLKRENKAFLREHRPWEGVIGWVGSFAPSQGGENGKILNILLRVGKDLLTYSKRCDKLALRKKEC
jgi:hypothetical protein